MFISWLWVGLCSIAIFLTVPIAREIQKFVYDNWGSEVFIYFVLGVLAIGFIGLLSFLIFKLKIRSSSPYMWTFIVAGLYTHFILKIKSNPIETVHFLEYGLLSFFLFKALNHHIKDKSIYIIATLFALLIGTFDEILQWITPQRYWDFRDVGLNGLSGGLFQLAIWKVRRPKIISEKFNTKSLRILTSIFASCLIILGLCASNTPIRMHSYTKQITWLSFLQKEESMSEFGYKFNDSEIGTFYSRLSPKNLQKIDYLKGKQYSQILNESIGMSYNQFLREYNPVNNPFLHELRIHIFRRDTYLKKGKSTSNLNEREEFYLIAYNENLILEKYFNYSIEKSVYRWNEDILQELEASIDKSKAYESPVSANLFTSFTEKRMWIFILFILIMMGLVNFIYCVNERKRK